MARIPPVNATGTHDYLPRDLVRRNHVFALLRETFERYGFEPLETPAIENTNVLEGKYGEEGEKLLFRILKRGRSLESAASKLDSADERTAGALTRILSDEALRYDLTVPLARVIAAQQGKLLLPFRRYQMQPVWRADRPQQGRFREFFQCDVDCVGSASVTVEAEMLAMVSEVFERLGFSRFVIRVNHRALLAALLESEGVAAELRTGVLVAIDKLDKIGADGVRTELASLGVPAEVADRLMVAISITGAPEAVVEQLSQRTKLGENAVGVAALDDLRRLFGYLRDLGVPDGRYAFDVSTVRGLSYYTGIIYETIAEGAQVGSLCSGGRYDELIGQFTGRDLPCVGISFGLDRMFTAMDLLGLDTEVPVTATQALVTLLGAENIAASFAAAQALRAAGVRTEIYADESKALKAQISFADKKGIPLLIVIGDDERTAGNVTLRDLRARQQETPPLNRLATRAREILELDALGGQGTSISEIC
ncbi:MAG TPA: histidine--tRNA ligase [Ktedonobacterales bacterium]|jgi:histidyl-tRNA synthetase|nr:histidine--tRNA ligase [Ktedonobacterales bacterium]